MNSADISLGKYELNSLLGRGAFGVVYKGRNRKTGESIVIKTEPANTPVSTLKHETTLLNWLYSKSCRHIPPVYWYGVSSRYRALVIPFYSRSVEQYVKTTVQTDLTAISSIMRSAILILKDIHSKYIVHRDIKPANWMINGDELVLIDFGLASFYVDSDDLHITTETKTDIIGTPKFVSWNVHCGYTPSRRDDMISLAYVGLYMLMGGELWTDRPAISSHFSMEQTNILHPMNQWFKTKKQLDEVVRMIGEAWPQLAEYMVSVYGLGFPEMPAYDLYANIYQS